MQKIISDNQPSKILKPGKKGAAPFSAGTKLPAVYEHLTEINPAALVRIRSQLSDNLLENAVPPSLLKAVVAGLVQRIPVRQCPAIKCRSAPREDPGLAATEILLAVS